jgi:AcrR family transcriptional regulator
MAGDSAATKRRLLEAAAAEFAEFGIAGARIDRIARAARSNKQMIYAYFGSKDALFDAVFSAYVGESLDEVDFDAADLPAYAGRLFDQSEDQPALLRLSTWYRLERPQGASLQAVVSVNQIRLERLERAQEDGVLPGHLSPVQLLALFQSIATSWVTMNPEFGAAAAATGRDERRRAVVEAVQRLLGGAAVSVGCD